MSPFLTASPIQRRQPHYEPLCAWQELQLLVITLLQSSSNSRSTHHKTIADPIFLPSVFSKGTFPEVRNCLPSSTHVLDVAAPVSANLYRRTAHAAPNHAEITHRQPCAPGLLTQTAPSQTRMLICFISGLRPHRLRELRRRCRGR